MVMKIAYGSDLHLEFDGNKHVNPLPIYNLEDAHVLILAGDILLASDLNLAMQEFMDTVSKEFPFVLYVMGNHEHYAGDFLETKSLLKKYISPYSNVALLDNECVLLDDTAFFGGTLWTDLNRRDPYVVDVVAQAMNDFRCIQYGDRMFRARDTLTEHDKTLDVLKDALSKTKASKMVVITHHTPSSKSSHPRYAGDPTNYAYYSDLSELILDNQIIKAWIHGHTHDQYDYMIGETRVLCNPRGYKGIQSSADTWQVKYVEV
jgi:predicted phosphodiesterase